ncbi:MAG: hypothetical protein LBB94_09830 [Clostridiales bacterium]|jgi:hypothetical protein|nr:hypothetical protein [Clostridiales bacterium]
MRTKEKTPAAVKSRGKVMKMPAGKPTAVRRPWAGKQPSSSGLAARRSDLRASRAAASRNRALFSVTAVFFGFVLIYILQSLFVFALKPHTAIDHIAPGSITSPIDLEGVIIRDEKVYKSTASGSVKFNVAENERVKKGDIICSVQNTDEVNRINVELMNINEELLKIQTMREGITDLNGNGRRINISMKNMIDDWAGAPKDNSFFLIYALKDGLLANVELRNQIILNDVSDSIREQADKRQMYQEELNKNMTPVIAEESGVVSSLLDGYEETYTTNIMAVFPKELTVPKNGVKPLTVKSADPETPLFKIIHSNIWYIATYIPNEIIDGWKVNDSKLIRFDTNSGLPVTVDRLTAGDGESYVLFKCTRFMQEYINLRSIRFRVSGDASEGLKIPESAVTAKTLIRIPREYVSIEDDQLKRAKLVKSGGENMSFFYTATDDAAVYADVSSNAVTLGMEIQNPADAEAKAQLTETAEITGVYRVNNGVTDFRKVVLSENQQNVGYYILDPNLNRNLQEKDSIVHDAASVKEGQIIF